MCVEKRNKGVVKWVEGQAIGSQRGREVRLVRDREDASEIAVCLL